MGIGNQVFEAGITAKSNAISIGYGLDYEPKHEPWQEGATYVNHFLARLHHKAYEQEKFSAWCGLSLSMSIGFHGSSREDRGGMAALFIEPEYMLTNRFAAFATCNALSYIIEKPDGSTDGSIDISPDVNLGIRFKFGHYK